MAARSGVLSLGRFLGAAGEPAGAVMQAALGYSTAGGVAAYSLPELPYAYSALEPVISGQIMELHHAKHHATYVANLNKALEAYADAEAKKDLPKMIALQPAINFNGGGAARRGGGAAAACAAAAGASAVRQGAAAGAGCGPAGRALVCAD